MTKDEARVLVEAKRADSQFRRPQSSEADPRPAREQLWEAELANFETLLAEAARAFERTHGHWPFPGWFTQHRSRFGAKLRDYLERLHSDNKRRDKPCKHWAKGIAPGNPILPGLAKAWEQNLHKYARQYPYLASPSAPCECRRCSRDNVTILVRDQHGEVEL